MQTVRNLLSLIQGGKKFFDPPYNVKGVVTSILMLESVGRSGFTLDMHWTDGYQLMITLKNGRESFQHLREES